MSRVRRGVGTDRIEARPPGYLLRVESSELDASRFEELVRTGLAAGSRPEAAAAGFESALALWRGTPFAEFADDEFATAEVARLTELRTCAVEEYAAALVELSRPGEALGVVEAQLASEPYRERLRAVLMLALARAGRQVEALRAFDTYRRVLADEVGVQPSAALRTLNDEILREHPDLGWQPPPHPAPGVDDDLPSGTVTFLFTDVERSTQLWEQHRDAMVAALARHDAILRGAIEAHAGRVVKTTGDGFHAVSRSRTMRSTRRSRRRLRCTWSRGARKGRCGFGWESIPARVPSSDGDYYGPAVNRAARLMALANGGQVLVSRATEQLVGDLLSEGVELADLGEQRLKDLARPERVFQVLHPELPVEFGPLRSYDAYPGNLPSQMTSFVGRGTRPRASHADARGSAADHVDRYRRSGQDAARVGGRCRRRSRYAGGVWFCELAGVTDPDGVPGGRSGRSSTSSPDRTRP